MKAHPIFISCSYAAENTSYQMAKLYSIKNKKTEYLILIINNLTNHNYLSR